MQCPSCKHVFEHPSDPDEATLERVSKGAKLLDEHGPRNWADRVNVNDLLDEDGFRSPFPLVFGREYGDVLRHMNGRSVDLNSYGDCDDYATPDKMVVAWTAEINKRRTDKAMAV